MAGRVWSGGAVQLNAWAIADSPVRISQVTGLLRFEFDIGAPEEMNLGAGIP